MSCDTAPIRHFETATGEVDPLDGIFAGRSAFLICGGPSFANMGKRVHRVLSRPGFLTMGVNNAPKIFRPNIWTCVDEPDHFIRSVFYDPKVMKFLPIGKRDKQVFDSDAWEFTNTRTKDCPNVHYYRLTHDGFPNQFLSQRDFFWGFDGNHGGGRSVMHVAPKILYTLGIKRIFLLGCDFHMSDTARYAFDQHRTDGSIRNNNITYAKLNERFKTLRPQFEAAGLHIYNCTPNSQLEAFDRMDFMSAADQVQQEFNVDVHRERTYGLYERNSHVKAVEKWRSRAIERMEAARQHVDKAIANPGVERFHKRAVKAIDKAINAARVSIQHENEATLLRCWPRQPQGANEDE